MLHIRNWSKTNQSSAGVNLAGYCNYGNQVITDGNENKKRSILH
jgi:hypothetical protein